MNPFSKKYPFEKTQLCFFKNRVFFITILVFFSCRDIDRSGTESKSVLSDTFVVKERNVVDLKSSMPFDSLFPILLHNPSVIPLTALPVGKDTSWPVDDRGWTEMQFTGYLIGTLDNRHTVLTGRKPLKEFFKNASDPLYRLWATDTVYGGRLFTKNVLAACRATGSRDIIFHATINATYIVIDTKKEKNRFIIRLSPSEIKPDDRSKSLTFSLSGTNIGDIKIIAANSNFVPEENIIGDFDGAASEQFYILETDNGRTFYCDSTQATALMQRGKLTDGLRVYPKSNYSGLYYMEGFIMCMNKQIANNKRDFYADVPHPSFQTILRVSTHWMHSFWKDQELNDDLISEKSDNE